ncbi:glutathione S-transferase family protein [Colwellia echini]|uniref:Glutathione S-transferase n=1 Tax=Colwellia echini TaxID=1982103 RepID=A0ABY3MU07_9GAMM|nr:glutathione S-transferase [Colwellia echini]TYK64669.1 glutathione S-transferase [Colwellia echini]
MFKLYYYPNNASLAPHFLLHHLKADYELLLVDTDTNAHKSADYLKLNPAGLIPTLVVNDQPIFESPAICIHICELHPESELMPTIGDFKRPLFFQWLAYLNNTLQAEIMVFNYAHRHTNDESTIANIKAAQEDRIADALSIINDQLEHNKYLLGDTLTACDYFLFMLMEWCSTIEKSPLTFKHIAAYLRRLCTNPTIKAVCDIEGLDLSPFK